MNRKARYKPEPIHVSKEAEIAYLREVLSDEKQMRYDAQNKLEHSSKMTAVNKTPKNMTDLEYSNLSMIDKRILATLYWNDLTDERRREFTDNDFKEAEQIYKEKVKERMADPIKMKQYFLETAAPVLDNIINGAVSPSDHNISETYATKEVWEVLKGILTSASNPAPLIDLKGKSVSAQIDEILTNLTEQKISMDEAKELMSLVSSGFSLQQLPLLMQKLEAIEAS